MQIYRLNVSESFHFQTQFNPLWSWLVSSYLRDLHWLLLSSLMLCIQAHNVMFVSDHRFKLFCIGFRGCYHFSAHIISIIPCLCLPRPSDLFSVPYMRLLSTCEPFTHHSLLAYSCLSPLSKSLAYSMTDAC